MYPKVQLGPVLFLIYINFVINDLKCPCKIFADDMKLYLSYAYDDSPTGVVACQEDINKLVNTSSSWGLYMNVDKCSVIRFSPSNCPLPINGMSPYMLNNSTINFTNSQSDLGVTIDRSLKFHSHIQKNVGIAGGLTTNLLSCTLCRSEEFLMNLYCSHVRPKMEYCSSLWNLGYVGDTRKLERIQRQWTREVSGLESLPYGDRLRRLKLFSFQGRLLRNDLVMVWKILNNKCGVSLDQLFRVAPTVRTRGHQYKLFLTHSRLEIRRRFFSVRVISRWNSLSADAVEADTVEQFKFFLHRDLGDELYEFC